MTETSGPIASASYLKWDQNTQFWRTFQASLWEMENGQHMGAGAPHLRNRWWLVAYPNADLGGRLHREHGIESAIG